MDSDWWLVQKEVYPVFGTHTMCTTARQDRLTGTHDTGKAAGPAIVLYSNRQVPLDAAVTGGNLTWGASSAWQWQQPSQVPEHGPAAAASQTPGAAQQSQAQALP